MIDLKTSGYARTMVPSADYGATAPAVGTTCLALDTRGFQWARIDVNFGTMAGTSIAWKLQESSDNAVGDAYADITGATGTTITTSNDVQTWSIVVDTRKCERYVRLLFTFTSVTVSNIAAQGFLFTAKDSAFQYQNIGGTAVTIGSEVSAIVV